MENNSLAIAFFGVILGASILGSAFFVTGAMYKIRGLDNILSVTGSTRVSVTSDSAKWISNITRSVKGTDLKSGYVQMDKDLQSVLKFFKDNGVKDSEIKVNPVFMDKDYSYNKMDLSQEEQQYILRQSIEVSTTDVNKIAELSKDTNKLMNINALFSTQSIEYYISQLPELRINLLSDAMKDAKVRAEKIAESSEQKVGSLKSTSMGSVMVLSPNSNVGDGEWSSYDTSTIQKDVMITVRASFLLE